MTVTEALNSLYEDVDSKGIDLSKYDISNDEDLIILAINYLANNIDDVFDEIESEMEEINDELVAL